MGLLLRPDAYYAETPDGAYVRTHQGGLTLTGRTVYQLIDRLAPYLDGRHSLADLTATLPPARRAIVENLLTTLLDRGVVRDLAPPGPEQPPAHQPEHDFLGYFLDSGPDAFQAFRDTPAVIAGSGALLAMAGRAALRSGLARVRIVATAGDATATVAAVERGRRDPGQRLSYHQVAGVTRVALDGAGLVVHVADRMTRAEAEHMRRLCAGVPLYQASAEAGEIWSGALAAGWRRLSAWRRTGGAETPTLAASVAASQILHRVLRTATGIDGPAPDQLSIVDTATLRTHDRTFRPHPLDLPATVRTEAEFRARIDALRTAPRLDPETFSRQVMRCVDDRVGLVAAPTERDYEQIPLHVSEIAVSDPAGLLPPGTPRPVAVGTGLDFATARHAAAVRAIACYASLMVDPRRLESDRVWGFDLADQVTRPVRAARAFPVLDHAGGDYAPAPGVAAGFDWTEAVLAGLLGHCRSLCLRTATHLADIEITADDPVAARYLGMLKAIGQPVCAWLLAGPLTVPTVVCGLAGRPVGCASGLTTGQALRDALGQTVLHYQSSRAAQPGYAPPELPALPGPGPLPAPAGPLGLSTVVGALRAIGHRPVVVPLDHDPEVSAVLPHTLHVVLDDD